MRSKSKNADFPYVFLMFCFFFKKGHFGKYSNKPSRAAGNVDFPYVVLMIFEEIIKQPNENQHFCSWAASWPQDGRKMAPS